jgi:hypothetical protein
MSHRMNAARSTDLSSLGKCIAQFITAAQNHYGRPATTLIFTMKNHAQRGFGLEECGRLLCPRADRDDFDDDPDQ